MRDDADTTCTSCALNGVYLNESVNGIDRRRFVSRAVLAAAATVLAACGGADAVTGTLNNTIVVTLVQYPALSAVGGVATVTSGGVRLALVRTSSTAFAALSLTCPHEGASVTSTSTGFTCSRHGARFNTSGTWIGGQRTSSLRSYPTAYDANAGTVTIG